MDDRKKLFASLAADKKKEKELVQALIKEDERRRKLNERVQRISDNSKKERFYQLFHPWQKLIYGYLYDLGKVWFGMDLFIFPRFLVKTVSDWESGTAKVWLAEKKLHKRPRYVGYYEGFAIKLRIISGNLCFDDGSPISESALQKIIKHASKGQVEWEESYEKWLATKSSYIPSKWDD